MENQENYKIEYLQMIQTCIERMSTLSSIFKGFAATLVVGLSVIINSNELQHKVILSLPLLLFIFMDIYYLYLEKSYRELYEDIREGRKNIDFDLKLSKRSNKLLMLFNCIKSYSIWLYYVPLIIIIIFVIIKE